MSVLPRCRSPEGVAPATVATASPIASKSADPSLCIAPPAVGINVPVEARRYRCDASGGLHPAAILVSFVSYADRRDAAAPDRGTRVRAPAQRALRESPQTAIWSGLSV